MDLLFPLLVAAGLGLGACSHHPAAQSTAAGATAESSSVPTTATAPEQAAQPVMIFAKTPCLGRCPYFKATIYRNGRVVYEGYKDVPKIGTYELQLPPATVETLLVEARQIGFNKLPDSYVQPGTADMPATSLTIRQPDGSTKSVRAETDLPPALQRLFNHINQEIDAISGGPAER